VGRQFFLELGHKRFVGGAKAAADVQAKILCTLAHFENQEGIHQSVEALFAAHAREKSEHGGIRRRRGGRETIEFDSVVENAHALPVEAEPAGHQVAEVPARSNEHVNVLAAVVSTCQASLR
jgi:hypothetical protein